MVKYYMIIKLDSRTLLGLAAGALTTFSLLPQVIKTWKSRSTQDISIAMFVILCAGLLTWVLYGFMINSMPVILANIVSFFLGMVVVVLKLKHG